MPSVADISRYLDSFAPRHLAAEWDNVGLLLGDSSCEVSKLLTCLTITPEVAAEAVSGGANMIVSHHPILFRGAKKLSTETAEGRLLWPLLRAGIAVHSPHTAFDNATNGINDIIARKLQLTDVQPLRRGDGPRQHKIVVFVPEADLCKVSDALFAAGAGVIGQYRECSYRLAGTGTFFGSEASNPTIGQRGRREEVSEWRLEVVCPEANLAAAIAAMRKAHSYEEPAFDVYSLQALPTGHGEGRVGRLASPVAFGELAKRAKHELRAGAVQCVGSPNKQVEWIAIACGAAGEFLDDALRAHADVFLTGEMRFHDYLKAQAVGIALILPGHYATERPAVEELAVLLTGQFRDVEVWASRAEADPVIWV